MKQVGQLNKRIKFVINNLAGLDSTSVYWTGVLCLCSKVQHLEYLNVTSYNLPDRFMQNVPNYMVLHPTRP